MKIREILSKLDVKPTKKRGQNFLYEPSAAAKIVSFAGISKNDAIVEIGPGLGALTEHIIPLSEKYLFVEIENKFREYLLDTFDVLSEENAFISSILDTNAEHLAGLSLIHI